ncbi:MAG: response regulator transcription factor [Candidatus Woesebacteria bacterium]|nr:MAG: response regulator transcription factor [Candidatus Woesebacteria bacterium]
MRLLLLEDDTIIAANIKSLLKGQGYAVDLAETIEEADLKISDNEYDCLILDRKLPDGEGLDLVKKLRVQNYKTPILILTARNQNYDQIEGLNVGADDYLAKPFDIDVLSARIRTLIRRGERIPSKPIIKIDDLVIDTNSQKVLRQNIEINLSPREYSILEYLALHKGQVIDRMTLLTHVWDENVDLFSNTVDVHIRYLRNKIDVKHRKKLIKTVRGGGYILCD